MGCNMILQGLIKHVIEMIEGKGTGTVLAGNGGIQLAIRTEGQIEYYLFKAEMPLAETAIEIERKLEIAGLEANIGFFGQPLKE